MKGQDLPDGLRPAVSTVKWNQMRLTCAARGSSEGEECSLLTDELKKRFIHRISRFVTIETVQFILKYVLIKAASQAYEVSLKASLSRLVFLVMLS